jgi:hypothetical protein
MKDWILAALVVVLAFLLIGPRVSGYTASTPMSIMDLAEFKGLPDDVKQFYQDQLVNRLLPAVSAKFGTTWAAVPAARKQEIIAGQRAWVDDVINKVNSSSPVIS